MSDMRVHFALVTACVAAAACTDAPTSLPPESPIVLETTELPSGGEGVLVSEMFRHIELVSAKDSLEEPVERRWSNFAVMFGADTVDSWRLDATSIGFRLPVVTSGEYTVRVQRHLHASQTMVARVLGLGYATSLGFCGIEVYRLGYAVPVSSEAAAVYYNCIHNLPIWGANKVGTFLLRPSRLTNALMSLDAATVVEADTSIALSSVSSAGPSYRDGHAVLEHPILDPPGGTPSTWVWRFDSNPAPSYEIACTPSFLQQFEGYVPAEVAPDVCVALTGWGRLYRNGELLYDMGGGGEFWWSGPTVRVSRQGTFAPTKVAPRADWAVVTSEGSRFYTIPGYRRVTGVAFTSSGDSMFVAADVGDNGDLESPAVWVLDIRTSESGALLARDTLDECGSAWRGEHRVWDMAYARDKLWLLSCGPSSGYSRIEVRSPPLSVIRTVTFKDAGDLFAGPKFDEMLPASDDRHVYVFGRHNRWMTMGVVDVF